MESPIVNSSSLLSAEQQIENLPPTRAVLNFYKDKLKDMESEFEQFGKSIQSYKDACIKESKLMMDLMGRDTSIAKLQNTISDLQMCLTRERNLVLKLKKENDRLRVMKNLQQTRKRDKINVPRKTAGTTSSTAKGDGAISGYTSDQLIEQLKALEWSLEDNRSKEAENQIQALEEDRKIQIDESKARKLADNVKLQLVMEKLKITRDFLCKNVEDGIRLRKCLLTAEQQILKLQELNNGTSVTRPEVSRSTISSQKAEPKRALKEPASRTRMPPTLNEVDKTTSEQLTLFQSRYKKLEERRKMENEGFMWDIRQLRKDVSQIESQLGKVCSILQTIDEAKDFAVLKTIYNSSKRSLNLATDLKQLKNKMSRIENSLKSL